ncbi:hypothetical protein M011DRAFT_413389 [Sporormia fimetaria CBS 119925]|uniref:Uncharacterized protein n=1 Tax=Sporormia fimetaria CBS 119925 TaxID=1340428 RepID=A0A6A6UX30_9PLEO|nr:hypothetical protein M011DRAFT_413389 [Sporormia fimetaria CBS 119925]
MSTLYSDGATSSNQETSQHYQLGGFPSLLGLLPHTIILHPSKITADFDELRFEAAVFAQLSFPNRLAQRPGETLKAEDESTRTSPLLISSPYNNPSHYLDLNTLDPHSLLFSLALTALKPARGDYATAPYSLALNFPTVIDVLRTLCREANFSWAKQSFYVVVFRSKLRADVDNDLLYKLDFESHREACEAGGLLKYWFGKPDCERRNLATCFWRSRDDAKIGGTGPWHQRARMAARGMYEDFGFQTLRFTVLEGVEGWEVGDWVEQD